MRPVVTGEEIKRAEEAAIAAGTPVEALMERAGRAVARSAVRMTGRRYGSRVVVVCGPGNNGGDGYVAARVLMAEGVDARCLTLSDPSGLKGPAHVSYERFRRAGGMVRPFHARLLDRADVVVDAIFGTGFHGRPQGVAAEAITEINRLSSRTRTSVLAVDTPSALGGSGPAVRSDVTVAVGAEKLETAVTGPASAGIVETAGIGLDIGSAGAWIPDPGDLASIAQRDPSVHKWSASVAVLAGSNAMTGAAALAARGAFRAGAGYVTLGTTPAADRVARARVPELVSQVVTDGSVLGPGSLDHFQDALRRSGAVVVGPGIGKGEDQKALVRRVLREVDAPVILDADGLNVLQDDTQALVSRSGELAITPHAGELGRLLDRSSAEIESDRVGAVREASDRFGCVVLLKGPRTLTCHRDRGIVINPTGGAELATAGTGDVLSGVIAAVASRDRDAFTAAWRGAYLHGSAGALGVERTGAIGLVAWDVAEALPEAIAALAAA
jgi:ADP-dependent NAD(P)H-hydrate dehydratase / NAD(P)H-hydrate epimerase